MKTLLLVDGHSLAHRAFYALPLFTTVQGVYTNAVFGFFTMLLRLLDEEQPDYVAVAFDRAAPTFRHTAFAEYKAQRPPMPSELRPQLELLEESLGRAGFAVLGVPGYEADDVIGTLAGQGAAAGCRVLILSGDRDVLQLVGPQVTALVNRRGISQLDRYDAARVRQEYGVDPERLPDWKALVGDPSDNLPGLPGIGPKKATALLREYTGLEELLKAREALSDRKLREVLWEHGDEAVLFKHMTTIRCDVPLEVDWHRLERPELARTEARRVFQELEFKSLLKRLPPPAEQEPVAAAPEVAEPEGLEDPVSVSLALLPRGPFRWELGGIALADGRGRGWSGSTDADLERVRALLESERPKYLHAAKAASVYLRQRGMSLGGLAFDTGLAAYLLNPGKSGGYPLEELASSYLAVTVLPFGKPRVGGGGLPEPGELLPGLRARASLLARLREVLAAQLESAGLTDLYCKVELPLVKVLAEMELAGVAVDRRALDAMGRQLSERLAILERQIYRTAGVSFNLNSPRQLAEVLFGKLGLPVQKRTKTGPSTDAEVLETLASQHEVVADILEYRQLVKLRGTYVDGLRDLIDPNTGRVHTTFHQTVTATGRLSSAEPNLQNIPVRMELGRQVRKVFVAGEGRLFLAADYSQIELRVLAHLSGDERLCQAFREEEDIHRRTASEVLRVAPEAVNDRMRNWAKAINFGIVYGISDFGLARGTGMEQADAKSYIDGYFRRYPQVKEFLDRTVAEGRERGYVTTLLGRRRYLPDLNHKNRVARSFAERMAMNTPIQGSAADIIKLAMLEIHRELVRRRMASRMILQVHDELLFEVPRRELEELAQLVAERMEQAVKLAVPLRVDEKVGPDWFDMEPLQRPEAARA